MDAARICSSWTDRYEEEGVDEFKMSEDKKFCVYCHTNKVNGKKYFGQTCQLPEVRWGKNGSGYKGCVVFYRAIQKYGWDSFEHKIIRDEMSCVEASIMEQELIALYNTMDRRFGYNILSGGLTRCGENAPFYGHKHTEEQKRKISERMSGKYLGEDNPNYGNHKLAGGNNPYAKPVKQYTPDGIFIKEYPSITEAYQELGVDKSTGISRNCNQTRGLAFGYIWLYTGEESKLQEKVKNAVYKTPTGKDSPCYGKKLSEEHKRKIGEKSSGKNNPSAKAVFQYDLDGNLVRKWDYCKQAADFLGKANGVGSICACANFRRKTAYGYVWRYCENER